MGNGFGRQIQVAGLILAVWVMGATAVSATCKVNQIGEIQIRMDGNQPLMEGEINGKPVDLLADTGAYKSALFYSSLRYLGLQAYEIEGAKAYGVGGESKVASVNIESMKLGTVSTRNLSLFVFGSDKTMKGPAAGLLGGDFFSQADIEFDLAHHVIRFLKPVGCKGDEVLYWPGAFSELPLLGSAGDGADFSVEIKLNGHPFRAQLDTGASITTVTWPGAYAAGIPKSALKPLSGAVHGIGKESVPLTVATFDSFTFDQETIQNIPIEVADLFQANKETHLGSRLAESVGDAPYMLLGADFFLAHRVLISNSQHMVFITYNGGKVFQVGDAPDK